MLFNSFEFILFLPIVIIIYYMLNYKVRWIFLLGSSYYFYMSWNAKYVLLLLLFTIINYLIANKIYITESSKLKKMWLYISIISSFSLLFIFKYFNFLSSSITDFLNSFSMTLDPFLVSVLLPVGISFYTFQTVGYVLDVYWGKIKPEKHLGIFALYVSYFPQLVAGPIERAQNLLPQLKKKQIFSLNNFYSGLLVILWGFFLKVVIADRLSLIVNPIYNHVYSFEGLPLIIATYLFSFQIFCDFAGYSFIAIGSAKLMGVNLMENFRRPYFANSIQDFWQRWHISLSTWFKDYIYIPMGGSRVRLSRFYFNILTIFLISGIWHGANWTFFIWGILHGVYLIFGNIFKKYLDYIPRILKIFITFNLVSFSWIFFRANSLEDAYYVITHLFVNINFMTIVADLKLYSLGFVGLIIVLIFIFFMELVHLYQEIKPNLIFIEKYKFIMTNLSILFMIYIIILLGIFEESSFMYFQF